MFRLKEAEPPRSALPGGAWEREVAHSAFWPCDRFPRQFFRSILWARNNPPSAPQVSVCYRLTFFRPRALRPRTKPRCDQQNAAKSKRRKGFFISKPFHGFLSVSRYGVTASVFSTSAFVVTRFIGFMGSIGHFTRDPGPAARVKSRDQWSRGGSRPRRVSSRPPKNVPAAVVGAVRVPCEIHWSVLVDQKDGPVAGDRCLQRRARLATRAARPGASDTRCGSLSPIEPSSCPSGFQPEFLDTFKKPSRSTCPRKLGRFPRQIGGRAKEKWGGKGKRGSVSTDRLYVGV